MDRVCTSERIDGRQMRRERSMILDFNSLMRTAIFANVHRGSTSREAIDYAVGFVEFLPDL